MSTNQNKRFYGELRKIISFLVEKGESVWLKLRAVLSAMLLFK